LSLVVSMPIARAATSSSRIASQARRCASSAAAGRRRSREHDHEQQVVVLDRPAEGQAEKRVGPGESIPSIRIGSMRAMPCGPLVMLTGRDRLLRKIRTISPKPSVTIAR